jgi:hypothetical protein
MVYLAHESRLAKKDKDGVPYRAQLEASAKAGNVLAAKRLVGPDFPVELDYLMDWSKELVGRSGVGMDGPAPLSWACLTAWSEATGNQVSSAEASALMLLDGAMRHPEDFEDAE